MTRVPIPRFLLEHTCPQCCIFHLGPWLHQASPKRQMTDNVRHISSERKSTSRHRRHSHRQEPFFFMAEVSWCARCQCLTASLRPSVVVIIGRSGFGRIGRLFPQLHAVLFAAQRCADSAREPSSARQTVSKSVWSSVALGCACSTRRTQAI